VQAGGGGGGPLHPEAYAWETRAQENSINATPTQIDPKKLRLNIAILLLKEILENTLSNDSRRSPIQVQPKTTGNQLLARAVFFAFALALVIVSSTGRTSAENVITTAGESTSK